MTSLEPVLHPRVSIVWACKSPVPPATAKATTTATTSTRRPKNRLPVGGKAYAAKKAKKSGKPIKPVKSVKPAKVVKSVTFAPPTHANANANANASKMLTTCECGGCDERDGSLAQPVESRIVRAKQQDMLHELYRTGKYQRATVDLRKACATTLLTLCLEQCGAVCLLWFRGYGTSVLGFDFQSATQVALWRMQHIPLLLGYVLRLQQRTQQRTAAWLKDLASCTGTSTSHVSGPSRTQLVMAQRAAYLRKWLWLWRLKGWLFVPHWIVRQGHDDIQPNSRPDAGAGNPVAEHMLLVHIDRARWTTLNGSTAVELFGVCGPRSVSFVVEGQGWLRDHQHESARQAVGSLAWCWESSLKMEVPSAEFDPAEQSAGVADVAAAAAAVLAT